MSKKLLITLLVVGISTIGFLYARTKPRSGAPQSDCCPGENFGAIEGHVYDVDGRPVPDATVYAERTDAIMTISPSAVSDETGKFLIKDVTPGMYIVYGAKEKDGYPRTTSAFHYSDTNSHPQISVSKQQVSSNVIVRLGQKVPKLSLNILDSETKKSLRSAQATLRQVDNPDYLYSVTLSRLKGEEFEILAPTVSFTLEISAPGYADWKYRDLNQTPKALRLAPGEIRKMTIGLRRIK